MSIRMDNCYADLRNRNPGEFERVVAFASTFGQLEEEISLKTRCQVEQFCVKLALKVQP